MRILREVGYTERGHFLCTVVFTGAEGTVSSRETPEDCPRQTMVLKAAATLRNVGQGLCLQRKSIHFVTLKNAAVIVRAVKGSTGLNELP